MRIPHRRHRLSRLLIVSAALALAAPLQQAWPQQGVIDRNRFGRRVDDKPIPTQVVRGKLLSLERNGILVESEGKRVPIAINRDTRVELGAKGSLDFLEAGAIVEISGEFTQQGTVTLRERGWEGIEVCVTGQPPPRPVERGNEIVYTATAGSTVIPFKFVGTVINREPLVVRPLSNYPQPRLGIQQPGKPVQKLPEIKNKDLQVETPKGEGMLRLNLGNRLDLLGEGAEATVNVALVPAPVATRIYVERAEPFSRDQVPAEKKDDKGKGPKAGKSDKKSTGGKKNAPQTP